MSGRRPQLVEGLDAAEFTRWYWTMAELSSFAAVLGIARRGPKAELAERIRARLAGESGATRGGQGGPRKARLSPPFGYDTVLPDRVVLSRELRDWFIGEVGPSFRSNAALRQFLADGQGRTLRDALACYLATRHDAAPPIGAQFEYNAFVRSWWARHPDGTAGELAQAWRRWRESPVDERPPV